MRDRSLIVLAQAVLFLVPSLVILEYPPAYSWDMIAYMGVAASYFDDDIVEIHRTAYEQLREGVPQAAFEELTATIPYQVAVREDAASFASQLPFYRVKPLYPALVAGLHAAGLSLPDAQIAISKLSVVLTMAAAYLWFRRGAGRLGSSLLCCFMFSFLPVAAFSGWLTPDPLFLLLVVAYGLVLTSPGHRLHSFLFWPVLMLCRPDALILLLLIGGYLIWRGRHRKVAAAMSVAAVAQYVVQAQLSGNYGWATLFYHSFVEYMADPAAVEPRLTLAEYAGVYARNLLTVDTVAMGWWAGLGLAAALCYRRTGGREDMLGHLALLNSAFCVLH